MNDIELKIWGIRSIEEAIYSVCASTGRFVSGIWLFSRDGDNIQSTCIDLRAQTLENYKIAGIIARQKRVELKSDWSVIALPIMVISGNGEELLAPAAELMEQADQLVATGRAKRSEAYGFMIQAEGCESVPAMHLFHRDEEGRVVLDGGVQIHDQSRAVGELLELLNPWSDSADDHPSILEDVNLEVVHREEIPPHKPKKGNRKKSLTLKEVFGNKDNTHEEENAQG